MSVNQGQGDVTIGGAVLDVQGAPLAWATLMASEINPLLAKGENLTPIMPAQTGSPAPPPSAAIPIYNLVYGTLTNPTYTLPLSGYAFDTLSGADTISSAAKASDTVLVYGINSHADFVANGGKNFIFFADGNNQYTATKGDTGSDTIIGGTGFDTINTGGGATTVNTGTGDAAIYLNDTVKTTGFNDHALLDEGHSNVFANGAADGVIVTSQGQTVTGGATAQHVAVVLGPYFDSVTAGDNLVNAGGAATMAVFDGTDGNTINAGTGVLYVVPGPSVSAAVYNGAGISYLFGAIDGQISIATTAGQTGGSVFIAGAGNETLNGAAATSSLYIYGTNDSVHGVDQLTGGQGNDLLVAGMGQETLAGLAGTNTFLLDNASTAGATITISDFGASATNRIELSGFTPADAQTLVSSGSVTAGDYVVTMSNSATIIFDGLSSGQSLAGHLIVFS